MKLPANNREQFRRDARTAALSRGMRRRFGVKHFAELGLPGAELIDAGLADLTREEQTLESLLVCLAAPRLRREGVPVPAVDIADPESRLFRRLEQAHGDLAHARYSALLQQAQSFADACAMLRTRRECRRD